MGSYVAMDDNPKRNFSLMLNMTLGSCYILSLGIIASLVIFCACTIGACHQIRRVCIFTGNCIPIMCICDVFQGLVSPPVLTYRTSSMFSGNLRSPYL